MTRNIHNCITKFLFCKFREFVHQCVLVTKIALYLKITKKTGNELHKYYVDTRKLNKQYKQFQIEANKAISEKSVIKYP